MLPAPKPAWTNCAVGGKRESATSIDVPSRLNARTATGPVMPGSASSTTMVNEVAAASVTVEPENSTVPGSPTAVRMIS